MPLLNNFSYISRKTASLNIWYISFVLLMQDSNMRNESRKKFILTPIWNSYVQHASTTKRMYTVWLKLAATDNITAHSIPSLFSFYFTSLPNNVRNLWHTNNISILHVGCGMFSQHLPAPWWKHEQQTYHLNNSCTITTLWLHSLELKKSFLSTNPSTTLTFDLKYCLSNNMLPIQPVSASV